jgi:twitching motility protein PilJ
MTTYSLATSFHLFHKGLKHPLWLMAWLLASSGVTSVIPQFSKATLVMAQPQTVDSTSAPTVEPEADEKNEETVQVGVLGIRGEEAAIKEWTATMDYLTAEIPGYKFELVPMTNENTKALVDKGDLEFVVVQPGLYVDLELNKGANRLATLKNNRQGKAYTVFGGVILRRADRKDLATLKDIKGKKVGGIDPQGLGGWNMQMGELLKAGLNPKKDIKPEFFENQNDVVYAVRDGKVDVGMIRTDQLEKMEAEGLIDINDFAVMNQQTVKDFPFRLSTTLYPEWPFAALPKTPVELAEEVAVALFRMPEDSKAAKDSKSKGWTVPLNYDPVHDLFIDLKFGPYEDLGKISFERFLQENWYWFALALALIGGSFATVYIMQQKQAQKKLQAIAEEQRQRRQDLENHITKLVDEVESAAEGNLTVRASLDSEEMSTVADLFNAIIENLRDIAVEVKQSSYMVSHSLSTNAETIREDAERAISEAEEVQQALASVQAMSESVQNVAQGAGNAAAIAKDAYATVEEGSRTMSQMVDGILTLRATVGETSKKMKRLGESSQRISQVVSLIQEIAIKTNLLAINASVEASRAGEQGQGFTVVAEQVGTLAEQSAAAAKDIAKIVASIQSETQEVAEAMEMGTTQVANNTKLVEKTQQNLEEVLQKSQEISQLMQSISAATDSQSITSQEITHLMKEIALASELRSRSSLEMAQAIQSVAAVAKSLEEAVAQFRIEEEASKDSKDSKGLSPDQSSNNRSSIEVNKVLALL